MYKTKIENIIKELSEIDISEVSDFSNLFKDSKDISAAKALANYKLHMYIEAESY